ncbi:gliding motility-associated C-terminal domain-containing protein [Pedobacter metabolipauper]|uniref:Gliding motility-associated-like protein n=1 Tax=Pedobacter metabolipauper TaxID=425513 RepID=A0A4R6SVN7_9SPHI|nr:gliding motility-associated C-terminal domain-containing protein [Pedobacter metabolipauper]TDQ08519.1 gliding motility-associated-like protein [Pedobacter metabolipauper]
MTNLTRFLLFLSVFILTANFAQSQTCTGSLGDPVVRIDFGRGSTNTGPSIGSNTNYTYVPNNPSDGQYTIAKNTAGFAPGWYSFGNHTPNDPTGYMMVINAANNPGIFYETVVDIDLCPNTTYEFAAWVINMLNYNGIKPNITFSILTTSDVVLKTYNTGDIPDAIPNNWKQYGFPFETPANVNRVKIRMTNNGPGGIGNDIALDDITFRACGPQITTTMNNSASVSEQNICQGQAGTFTFSANIQGSATLKYLWQENTGSGWVDMPAENRTTLTVSLPATTPAGAYKYRLSAAEPGNFNSAVCRTASAELTVNVNALPNAVATSNNIVCLGSPIILSVTDAGSSYTWTGPNGFTSTQRTPTINGATFDMAGTYRVVVTSAQGCPVAAQTSVYVVPLPVAAVGNPNLEICEGGSAQLSASGGSIFRWAPAEGLSATYLANPVASPTETTTYTVTVSDGGCERTATVTVKVNKNPLADAGADKKIREGQIITLDGVAGGDDVRYFWSPATGLDDPAKINPRASPRQDMTYTLTVVSDFGCVTSSDQVFVKVYQKVIVPNSFSPNGDGTNDVWNITAIDTYPNPKVSIMNRHGEQIFVSKGYEKPWDGKYKNADVPVGVYYYIINLGPEVEPLTGSLMLIR